PIDGLAVELRGERGTGPRGERLRRRQRAVGLLERQPRAPVDLFFLQGESYQHRAGRGEFFPSPEPLPKAAGACGGGHLDGGHWLLAAIPSSSSACSVSGDGAPFWKR